MKATATLVEGLQFTVLGDSGHAILTDAYKDVGGHDTAPRPKELLLHSLTTCTGMDVVSILYKMRVSFSNFKVAAEAEVADEHPKVLTKIHITYTITGENVPEDKLLKAINLSQDRYCGVSAMLRKACPITFSYNIVEP
ncbi:OsmC family protein [bacterium]|nr:OsmC family protein [bacterium]